MRSGRSATARTAVFASAPFSFAPGPPPPPPTITLTPASGLQSGDTVTVDGSGFAPGTGVVLSQCVSSPASFCPFGSGGFVETDGSGAFSQTVRVSRGVESAPPFPPVVVDCGDASGTCSIVASSFDEGDRATAPLDFDTGIPVAVPAVTVTPSQDLGRP